MSPADGNRMSFSKIAAVDLVTQMMAIHGPSGGEHAVAEFVRAKLLAAGIPAASFVFDHAGKRSHLAGTTGNMIVRLPGTMAGQRRLLMAHMDTVPLCLGSRPVRRGAFIESRDPDTALGADNRAGCSVVLHTILEIKRQSLPHPPLTLLWSVQEEVGLLGVRVLSHSRLGSPKLCFNWDGGAPNVAVIGATGAINMDVCIDGIASHAGAHPDEGVSATAVASVAIADLVHNGWHGLVTKGRMTGTSNIGIIEGGAATNVVTSRIVLKAEARSHNRGFRNRIVANFRRAFERAANRVKDRYGRTASVTFTQDERYESFRMKKSEPCVRAALDAVEAVGLEPQTRIVNGGLDANWMMAHGYPTVTLGCGQQGIHTVEESLHVGSFLDACRIALRLATDSS